MKKITFLLAGLLPFTAARAQEPAAKTFWDDPMNNPATPIYVTAALVFIVFLLVLTVSIMMLRAFHMLIEQTERAKAQSMGVAYTPRPSWWSTLTQKLNDSVPVEREQDIDMGHSFDGIRELDNHLPPWWKWLFMARSVGLRYISSCFTFHQVSPYLKRNTRTRWLWPNWKSRNCWLPNPNR